MFCSVGVDEYQLMVDKIVMNGAVRALHVLGNFGYGFLWHGVCGIADSIIVLGFWVGQCVTELT